MTEKGMVFTGESIRAMLEGRKTVTRRIEKSLAVINENPDEWEFCEASWQKGFVFFSARTEAYHTAKPRYQVGDIVYARETLARHPYFSEAGYYADGTPVFHEGEIGIVVPWRWKRELLTARFMPKWAARIWREIVGVRPERLQEITEFDALQEGCDSYCADDGRIVKPREVFAQLWDSINPRFPWVSNRWVWRYEMKEVER